MSQTVISLKKATVERILDTSAELFNQFGIEAVSIAQIAAALKISTGNLTYHYKRKQDLVQALAKSLEQELSSALENFPYVSSPPVFTNAFVDVIDLTLRYRFLFTGANYILQNELIEFERYALLISTIKKTLMTHSRWLIKNGYMRAVSKPYSLELLLDSIWWQWLGWLHMSQLRAAVPAISHSKMLADAVTHIFFLAHPYVDEKFSKRVHEELRKISLR